MSVLPVKETLIIEFKSDKKGLPDKDLLDAIVAFANTEGGDLYLGIEDSGEVTGLNKNHSNPITLSAMIANNTVPPVSARVEIIDDRKPVLKISVSKSRGGIVATKSGKVLHRRIKADGTPENIPMYPNEYATRLSDLRLLDYSALPLFEASVNDFDPSEVNRLKSMILTYNGERPLLELEDTDLYKSLGMVREIDGISFPTITGILLAGKITAMEKYVPTAKASFQVLSGTEVRMNEDIFCPILETVEKMTGFISAWNPEQELEMGLFRMSIPDFDRRAVREALINAFSHRDYTMMGRVRVQIDDEGMTIANPGGFIEGISINNLLTAEPHGRNPMLADALKRIGLAERTGRGIDRIFAGSLLYGKLLPDYSKTTSVIVSLFLARSKPDSQIVKMISEEQKRLGRPLSINTLLVLNALKDLPKSDVAQIAEVTNLSVITVKSVLERAIETGLVDGYGTGRGRTYILSPKVYNTKSQKLGYVRQTDIDELRYEELIINLAKANDYISRADVIELLHINYGKAYTLLKRLVDKNRLKPINKGRYAKYQYLE